MRRFLEQLAVDLHDAIELMVAQLEWLPDALLFLVDLILVPLIVGLLILILLLT